MSMILMKFLQISISTQGLFHMTLRLALTHTGRSDTRQETNRSRLYTQLRSRLRILARLSLCGTSFYHLQSLNT